MKTFWVIFLSQVFLRSLNFYLPRCITRIRLFYFFSLLLVKKLLLSCTILCFDIKLTHQWQFYNHFRQFLCLMYVYLSQNWSSDGHFDMLNGSKFWLVQKLWHKMQIFPFPVPITYIKKMKICIFCFFAFFVISLEPIKI